MKLSDNQQNILLNRRVFFLMQQAPGFRSLPHAVELAFEGGFRAALNQSYPPLEGVANIEALGQRVADFRAMLNEEQRAAFDALTGG
ncbi:MAG: hypothetical protein AB7U98_13545 [Candidatus Nitrosocosmicus sp.]